MRFVDFTANTIFYFQFTFETIMSPPPKCTKDYPLRVIDRIEKCTFSTQYPIFTISFPPKQYRPEHIRIINTVAHRGRRSFRFASRT